MPFTSVSTRSCLGSPLRSSSPGAGSETRLHSISSTIPPNASLTSVAFIPTLLEHIPMARPGTRAKSVDLFDFILGHLQERGLLERALRLQREKGDEALKNALKGALDAEKLRGPFVKVARGLEPLQDRHGRPARPERRILMCDRRAKDRHDAVAGKALHDAALFADRVLHQLRQALHQREGGLLPGPFREGREADHVGEQDRDLPAFRFHSAASRLRTQRRQYVASAGERSQICPRLLAGQRLAGQTPGRLREHCAWQGEMPIVVSAQARPSGSLATARKSDFRFGSKPAGRGSWSSHPSGIGKAVRGSMGSSSRSRRAGSAAPNAPRADLAWVPVFKTGAMKGPRASLNPAC